MQKPISSKALEQNLTLTQNRQILIPEEDQTFLALCGSVFGIQKRLVHFLKEIYHPFPNFEVVIRSLRQILLEDHSFYFKHELFEISQQRFLEYLEILLNYQTIQKQFKSSDADCLIHTLISYIPLVHQLKHPAKDQFVNSFTGLFKVFALQNVNVFCSNLTLFYTLWNNRLNQADLFYWLKTVLLQNLEFWSDNTQILVWYHQNIKIFKMDYGELFYLISHQFFEHLKIDILRSQNLNDLQKIPSHNEIATRLRQNTSKLNHPFDQIYYLIYLLNHPGMLSLYHHMIFDIDKIIRSLDSISDDQDFEKFINNLFNLFENLRDQFKDSIPDCLASLAKAIVRLKRQDFTSLFITKLIRFGFEFVDKIEVSQDWQLIYNMQHIKYIRIYLEIYENSTDVYKLVLSALIANLRLGGIFISDTDLFQKDISKLLNSPVQNHFKLVKQLCRIFPVYYNEIGAEGDLRDYSTKLDELTHTRDILIHFLRKQIHTESNNTHIELCAKIIDFWDKLSFEVLTEAYPEHVIQQAKVTAEDHETHQYIQHIKLAFQCSARDILDFNQDMLKKVGNLHSDGLSKKRVLYLVKIYQFLKMKYAFDSVELCEVLKKHLFIKEKDINNLKLALIKKDNAQTVHLIIMMMKQLKRIVLNPELSEGREEIYYKRHVAAGIPSMYGRYFESKFDALGLSLRLEQSASVFISNLIAQLPLEYVTAGTLKRIHKILELINEGLIADGVENETFASNLKMLKFSLSSGSFSIEQYKNIFQFMQEGVKEIINEFFFRNFDPVLKEMMPAMFRKQTLEKDYKLFYHKKTEQFYRDLISSAFIIQTLDQFIASVIDAINTMQQTLPENIINMVMHFDTEKLLTH
ncbi:MAG TPA: hypothetical protein PKJ08_10205, partial [Candidatus Cloacimonadota bacterium]|nr:hypothetical protein [Candidatus Cloacimonadota bacterium]